MTETEPESAARPLPWPDNSGARECALVTLWRATARAPMRVGALAPSSRVCSAVMAEQVPTTGTPTVIELGAGTGAISDAAARRLPPGGHYLALEIDEELVSYLGRTRPWLDVVRADAAELHQVAAGAGYTTVDTVLSTLPWTLFSEQRRRQVLGEITSMLGPDGSMATLVTPSSLSRSAGRRFVRTMRRSFREFTVRPTWRTVSPAFVLIGTGPR